MRRSRIAQEEQRRQHQRELLLVEKNANRKPTASEKPTAA